MEGPASLARILVPSQGHRGPASKPQQTSCQPESADASSFRVKAVAMAPQDATRRSAMSPPRRVPLIATDRRPYSEQCGTFGQFP